jgi:glutamyl-tRNA synthetase
MIFVRFAPSPTGHLHIGSVRTALFNYLYARNQDGQFILRIEDTDISRSSREMAEEILEGLQWLGITWDQGPFYQSDRFEKYRETAYQLLEEKKAYRCFCTSQEIKEKIYKYDRRCLRLSEKEIDQKLRQKVPYVIRFLVPGGKTYFKDSLHQQMETDNAELEDFVILKSDNSPTYHLSVVKDDRDMGITHVIRGDDHISNTFKQVLLFKAMGQKPPKYAHLPLILGADKKKLSKRHGETSILEFKEKGYLPEALVTYLSQLSWLPPDSKKIFAMEELVKQFSLNKLSGNSPVFDYDKLRFVNSRAIRQKEAKKLVELLMEDETFNHKYASFDEEKKVALIDLVKPRMKTLADFEAKFAVYLNGQLDYNNGDLEKLKETYSSADIKNHLKLLLARLGALGPLNFNHAGVEEVLRECAQENGLKAADLIHPARFALTSETVSPSIFDVFAFFGKEESIKRMKHLIDYLEKENVLSD